MNFDNICILKLLVWILGRIVLWSRLVSEMRYVVRCLRSKPRIVLKNGGLKDQDNMWIGAECWGRDSKKTYEEIVSSYLCDQLVSEVRCEVMCMCSKPCTL
ncbi:hypothetical protein CEXT_232921 [Caerostris extrusa]|uniref:Uncharacterized protein n=1 Tax=Caerostris extrusa TaxID=172846 RepID=A0AAV4XEI9_CAEEX|nr:hypothetical protein CEXT_232921 [Caerostris extrusa]